MCWNIQATITFSVVYTLFIVLYYKFQIRNYKAYILFNSFYLIMELFQTFQWLYGEPGNCTITNKMFTYVAFVLIWFQPILFSIIGLFSKKKELFYKLLIINFAIFVYGTAVLTYTTENNLQYGHNRHDAIGNTTCTFVGKNDHLAWKFQGTKIDYQVNELLYLTLCAISFAFYGNEFLGIPFGWLGTLIATLSIFNLTGIEIASTWCLMSVFSNVAILLYHYLLYTNNAFENNNNNHPSSLN